jgi:hypothetical protein
VTGYLDLVTDETSVYVDDRPGITYDDVRRVAGEVIAAAPETGGAYRAWGVDVWGERIGELVPGAYYAVDIQLLEEPGLSRLAEAIRAALVSELGVTARLESEVADQITDPATAQRRRQSLSFRERLWDDSVFLPPDAAMQPPALAGQLLTLLGLRNSTRDEQEIGIREWLLTNHPSRSLAVSLGRRGFGHLLG